MEAGTLDQRLLKESQILDNNKQTHLKAFVSNEKEQALLVAHWNHSYLAWVIGDVLLFCAFIEYEAGWLNINIRIKHII